MYKRQDQAKADAERDARLKKAASQKQQFMTQFRNTDKYKELIAQRKDAAHAYKSEVECPAAHHPLSISSRMRRIIPHSTYHQLWHHHSNSVPDMDTPIKSRVRPNDTASGADGVNYPEHARTSIHLWCELLALMGDNNGSPKKDILWKRDTVSYTHLTLPTIYSV